jgi:S1-C subfamily serine protease
VTFFDLVVAGLAAMAAIGGYRLGFVTRVFSWIGLASGLLLAVVLLPFLIDRIDAGRQGLVLGITVGVAFLGAALGQALGFVAGRSLSPATKGAVSTLDRLAGAAAGVVGVVAMVWLVLPILVALPGGLSREVSQSWTAAELDERLPEPPSAVSALQALLGEDRFPAVFAVLEPTPDLGPPPPESGLTSDLAGAVANSVVKVEGVACRRVQTGTGFVVADGLVVTNAHVVAGESSTGVVRDDGSTLRATVVAFDPARDLALLAVPGLDRPALPLAEPTPGEQGAVFGHPLGQPLRLAPFQLGRTIDATGRDIYDQALTERSVLELAASLQHGDSGSPVVRADGAVVGVVFAVSQERGDVAYALHPDELREVLATPLTGAVGTGACVG